MDKRGGVSRFLVEKFGLTVPKKFKGEHFYAVFQKISGSENLMHKRGGGEYQVFPSKFFCLTGPKIFLVEPFFVSQNLRYRKLSGIREGVIHDFPSKIFLSQSAEKIHRGTLLCCVSENFW